MNSDRATRCHPKISREMTVELRVDPPIPTQIRASGSFSEAIGPQRPSTTVTHWSRIADKCARLYRHATLVALRIGRETYETAALPLSYVGADPE